MDQNIDVKGFAHPRSKNRPNSVLVVKIHTGPQVGSRPADVNVWRRLGRQSLRKQFGGELP